MNVYAKSSLIGIMGYLSILIFYYCIVVNKPNEFLACIFFGPFLWIPLLIYPGVLIVAVFIILTIKKQKISSSLISSTVIIYGVGLLLTEDIYKKLQGPGYWLFCLVAAISCFIGFIYAKWRTPNKTN